MLVGTVSIIIARDYWMKLWPWSITPQLNLTSSQIVNHCLRVMLITTKRFMFSRVLKDRNQESVYAIDCIFKCRLDAHAKQPVTISEKKIQKRT